MGLYHNSREEKDFMGMGIIGMGEEKLLVLKNYFIVVMMHLMVVELAIVEV